MKHLFGSNLAQAVSDQRSDPASESARNLLGMRRLRTVTTYKPEQAIAEKITYDIEDAIKSEAGILSAAQAALDSSSAELEQAELTLSKLNQRHQDATELVPLGGATKDEVEGMAARLAIVAQSVDRLKKVVAGHRARRDDAADALEKARCSALTMLRQHVQRIADDSMQKLFAAITAAVRANLEVQALEHEIVNKGIEGVRRPASMYALLPSEFHYDPSRQTSAVSQYKRSLRDAGYSDKDLQALYDASDVGIGDIRQVGNAAR